MKIEPRELFCAYHLGLTAEGGYRFQNAHDVADRFGVSATEIARVLGELGLSADAILDTGFDVASAHADVMTAETPAARRELAYKHYERFLAARSEPRGGRDWAAELAEDARENERTFGPPRRRGDGE